MAEEANGAGGPPAAIERSRLLVLPVSKKTVEVRRWSYPRLAMVNRYLNEIVADLPDDLDEKKAIDIFYKSGTDRLFEVAKFSVPQEQRAMLDEETFDHLDLLSIMDTAFELNSRGGGMGKMSGLAGKFLLQKAAAQAQRESETKPTAAK